VLGDCAPEAAGETGEKPLAPTARPVQCPSSVNIRSPSPGDVRMDSIGNEGMDFWSRYLDDFVPSPRHKDESYALRACRLALDAARAGSYGVGAVLLDASGRVIVEGRNRVYDGGFRSDLHAEMVVMNAYESSARQRDEARGCTLVTSLEPCPMCMARLIVAGIGSVLYMSEDSIGGMVRRERHLPPTFRAIIQSQGQVWGAADCSDELRAAAFRIWVESRASLGQWVPWDQRPVLRKGRIAAS
jgi:tRNA(adenine34) deaminase